ncbi:hypothetical protein [Ensifer sp. MJa1]|uniref:hypothetical protein n=1 Tax=Ensifer sp. MJa1 TaxID=2919888 RepID=UPI003008C05D
MSASGYSGTPLARKLGLKDGQVALLLGVPAGLDEIIGFSGFSGLETTINASATRSCDYIHLFETRRSALEECATDIAARLKPEGVLWASWPKKASKVATTLTEDGLREVFLPLGLVDIKVCAVDATWSGLKFMFRKELRSQMS